MCIFSYSMLKITMYFESKEGIFMAKAGMRRPDPSDPHGTESNKKMKSNRNTVKPVKEIQGKAKTGNKKAGLI